MKTAAGTRFFHGDSRVKRIKMVIPKGRLYGRVVRFLNDAGFGIEADENVLIPKVAAAGVEAKVMKPQNIPRLIELGSHDVGFTGHDWVVETKARVAEAMDLGFDPVKIVAAVPASRSNGLARRRQIVVASEYENIARRFLNERGIDYIFLRTYGATEAFPPDDADMIIDNVATGRTLLAHNLKIMAVLLESTTQLIVHPGALKDPWKRETIAQMEMLLRGVLDASRRVMLEMNVPTDKLQAVVKRLPCMRSPTVSPLYGDQGYSVKVAVPRESAPGLILLLKKMGAGDILEYKFEKVVP